MCPPRLDQEAVVDEHPEQLLDVQRVALGGRLDPVAERWRERCPTGERGDQAPGGVAGQRVEQRGW